MGKNPSLIYVRALLVVALAFALANRIDLHRHQPCCDFIYTRGIPLSS
ncbi:MAG TPA: hypothetical protein VHV32_11825 [Candidatus Angelobacter sp.]|jgi:hypothetical protein|nr:hypothetical protein [Candidatus Angelobacter sp.]